MCRPTEKLTSCSKARAENLLFWERKKFGDRAKFLTQFYKTWATTELVDKFGGDFSRTTSEMRCMAKNKKETIE